MYCLCVKVYYCHRVSNQLQLNMTPVGFEPTISAGERPQTYALDRAATGTGAYLKYYPEICLEGLGETTKNLSHVC